MLYTDGTDQVNAVQFDGIDWTALEDLIGSTGQPVVRIDNTFTVQGSGGPVMAGDFLIMFAGGSFNVLSESVFTTIYTPVS